MRYPTVLHLCFTIWTTWQFREGTWHKCKAAGHLANADRALLPCYSRPWGTLRAVYSPSGTLSQQKLPPPRRHSMPQGFAPSFFAKSIAPPFCVTRHRKNNSIYQLKEWPIERSAVETNLGDR